MAGCAAVLTFVTAVFMPSEAIWFGVLHLNAAAVLLTGLGRTLLHPKDVNYYENRPANTVAPLTAESWLDGSFQDAMETALSDQIPLAQTMKKAFK